ncbi:CYFA0S01e05666g1_1 [Cyberlindnera fabianii]|nr:CYFA0S01e05666g1_1 [Cyberlindnera fabianii]
MGSGSMETMTTPTSSMAHHSGMASMTMSSMDMASSSATASMDMSSSQSTDSSMGMGMDMGMSMNSHLTTKYAGYPVVFETLQAASGGAAFGIFCVLFFSAFFFRGLSFLGAYIEQRVFVPTKLTEDAGSSSTEEEEIKCCGPATATEIGLNQNTSDRSVLAKFFHVTPQSLYRDFVRLIIVFVSTMIGYALMLAAMSFVLLYFFAIVLGIAFGEIFFLRLSHAFGIRPAGTFCVTLH